MRIKRFIAPDMRTALKMVRDEHGPDAVILSNRPVHGGIEVVAATDYDEALVQQALRTAGDPAPAAAPSPSFAPSYIETRPATALDAIEDFAPATLPIAAPAMREQPAVSRADAMIAALAGNNPQAQRTRTALAERARGVSRMDAQANAPTPALAAMLREPAHREETAAPPAPPAHAFTKPGDDFRALLARLTDAEETSPAFSEQAKRMAQSELDDIIQAPDYTDAVVEAPQPATSQDVAPAVVAEVVATPVEEPMPVATVAIAAPAPIAVAPAIQPPEPTPAPAAVQAAERAAPTFAEFIDAQPLPVAPRPQAIADAFDPLAEMAAAQLPAPPAPAPVAAPPSLQVVASQSEDPTIVAMRNELTSMRQMIERQMGQYAVERLRGSPARALAFETLQAYGCDESLAQTIAGRIDPRMEPAKVRAPLLAELARMLTITRAEPLEDGGVFALIGPTGAGKTTTLAKLASRFAQRHRARDVALVTTDVERPGAREQLHALGRKLGVTVCEANGPEGLTDALDQLVDYPLVLVDTAGYAARDKALLGQVTWLRATRNLRSLLVLPANLQTQDMAEAVRRYRMAAPEAVVLTKLDETGRLGGALSVAIKHGLPLAYTTAGQQVPADLEAADASRLVLQLEKLRRAADNPLATEERHVVA